MASPDNGLEGAGRREQPSDRRSRQEGGSLGQGEPSGEPRVFQSFLSAEAAGKVCRPGLKGRLSPALVPARGLLSLPGNPCPCVPRHTAMPRQACTHSHIATRTHTQRTHLWEHGSWLFYLLTYPPSRKCLRYTRCSENLVL